MDAQQIIAEIKAHAAARGLKTTSLCQMVFRNPRYLQTLEARLARLEAEGQRLAQYLAEHPPEPPRRKIRATPPPRPASRRDRSNG